MINCRINSAPHRPWLILHLLKIFWLFSKFFISLYCLFRGLFKMALISIILNVPLKWLWFWIIGENKEVIGLYFNKKKAVNHFIVPNWLFTGTKFYWRGWDILPSPFLTRAWAVLLSRNEQTKAVKLRFGPNLPKSSIPSKLEPFAVDLGTPNWNLPIFKMIG